MGVTLPELLREYSHLEGGDLSDQKVKKRYEMRLRRWLNKLSSQGLVHCRKEDGLIWVKVDYSKLVDLMSVTSRKILTIGGRRSVHRARVLAREFLLSCHPSEFYDVDDVGKLRKCLAFFETLSLYFDEYLDDVDEKIIVLGLCDDVLADLCGKRFLLLRYNHRFRRGYLKRLLLMYEGLWEVATRKFDVGVFFTATLDPKRYRNLLQASRLVSEAFDRFIRCIRKRVKHHVDYIRVNEIQVIGNPHPHTVLFGVGRIGEHFELTELLKREGFGEVHYEYKIVNRNGKWTWANKRHRPAGCKNMDVKDYLCKYLSKSFSYKPHWTDGGGSKKELERRIASLKLAFYFASGMRFFTSSRSLLREIKSAVFTIKVKKWFYVGSWHWLDLPQEIVDLSFNPLLLDLIALEFTPS